MTQDGHFSLKELKNLKGTAKIQFIWDYYKIPIFLICACVYAAGYIVWRNVTAEFPQLYMAYVNIEAGETLDRLQAGRPDLLNHSSEPKSNAPVRVAKKVGRNDPCPCGSGKKYKNCHGKEQAGE